jgi:tyrosinase
MEDRENVNIELQINNSPNPNTRFVSWAPSPCRIRVTNPVGSIGPTVILKLSGKSAPGGGALVFRSGTTGAFASTLTLTVPTNGSSISFFTAGKFGQPSVNNGDVSLEARMGTTLVGAVPLMVRVRKNANVLTNAERDRFIAAFAQLNNQGLGRFQDFREAHTAASSPQAHFRPGFLPWHRAFILDLERELQAIDPSVSLHYWRFDQAAPKVFTLDFMGLADPVGTLQFSNANPLRFWVTDGIPGINRPPHFITATQSASVISENATLGLGSSYPAFRGMENNPHGFAHTSFGGSIHDIPTAAKDPLFFMLHCNVDRLWAKWQKQFSRFNPATVASYDSAAAVDAGHHLADSMWPWNGITGGTRPPTAPGGNMAPSPNVSAPGLMPKVSDMFDLQGRFSLTARLGYDYDDVSFA